MSTDPKYPLTETEASTEAARLIREAYRLEEATPVVTTFRDTSPVPAPAIGTAAPVAQPDSRIVPEWATGIAVASIGIGAGVTGIGCGAWLILEGLSSMTLLGVIGMFAPFAGIGFAAIAVGGAISRARRASTTNIYKGTVVQRTEITSTARGIGARSRIEG